MTAKLTTTNQKATLRRGWTTGACATAATKSAVMGLLTGEVLDPVEITLPKGQQVSFALCGGEAKQGESAWASIIKDAGDDPDVTHGALITVRAKPGVVGQGLRYHAGRGVGTVTREGLPIPVGEASITPVPRQMIADAAQEVTKAFDQPCDFDLTFEIENGAALAKETLNPRLGIVGGLSILGTTGIVIPYSCASWIHSIHRGIDVARAAKMAHVLASTGNTSETAANKRLQLPEVALLDMGDFAGGLLKYLKTHPIPRLTIAGGPGKLSKLAQGHLDLHSSRSQVDLDWLCTEAGLASTDAQSAAQLLLTYPNLAILIAERAAQTAQNLLGPSIKVDSLVFDRRGNLLAESHP